MTMAQQNALPEVTDVAIEYSWDVSGAPDVEQRQIGDRSATRIRPCSLTISSSRYRGGLGVSIAGRQVRLDGELGSHRRSVQYETEDSHYREPDPARRTEAMPEWARPYLKQAQAWEARR